MGRDGAEMQGVARFVRYLVFDLREHVLHVHDCALELQAGAA